MPDELTADEIEQTIEQLNSQFEAGYRWGISQAADLRGKAELMEEMNEEYGIVTDEADFADDLDCVPGTARECRELAERCEMVAARARSQQTNDTL